MLYIKCIKTLVNMILCILFTHKTAHGLISKSNSHPQPQIVTRKT